MESFRSGQDSSRTPEGGQEALEQKIAELENEKGLLEWHIEYLEEQQGIDFLTGAKTRKVFERELERSLKLIRGEIEEHRTHEPLKEVSLIFVDLDHFKNINDTYGHPAGDDVLQKVAALLIRSVRDTDVVARVGGEEFVVLLRGANAAVAARSAEDFRVKISQMAFEKHPDLNVTASFGVTSSTNAHETKALYESADQALYRAKNAGRNQVVIAEKV